MVIPESKPWLKPERLAALVEDVEAEIVQALANHQTLAIGIDRVISARHGVKDPRIIHALIGAAAFARGAVKIENISLARQGRFLLKRAGVLKPATWVKPPYPGK